MDQVEYKFPDEVEETNKGKPEDDNEDIQIEIEDDTPPQDRGRRPSEPEFVEQLDKDELDEEHKKESKERVYKRIVKMGPC